MTCILRLPNPYAPAGAVIEALLKIAQRPRRRSPPQAWLPHWGRLAQEEVRVSLNAAQ